MSNSTTVEDRTGHKIQPKGGIVVIEVIAKVIGANVYVCQDHIVTDPQQKGGAYFVTGEEMEQMIVSYESGDWSYEL